VNRCGQEGEEGGKEGRKESVNPILESHDHPHYLHYIKIPSRPRDDVE
jgi:hypothetical protein